MKFLTANNQRVQNYIMHSNDKPSTKKTKNRMTQLAEILENTGTFFSELFPVAQARVIDEIIYLSSGCGIAKIGSDRLAERSDVSVRTVTNAVKALKLTNQFIVARIANGRAGKYIFVDKMHSNFGQIMNEVFSLNAELFAELQNMGSTGAVSTNSQKLSSNHYNYLKHALNNYISYQTLQNVIDKEKPKTIIEQRKYLNVYSTNTYQKDLFEFIVSMPYADIFIQQASIIALRIGSDADRSRFTIAKRIINSMALDYSQGTQFDNVVASFSAGLKKAIIRHDNKSISLIETETPEKPIPIFYNWLEEKY